MKKYLLLSLAASLFISYGYCQDDAHSNNFNYTSFSVQQAKVTPELDALTSADFKSHPEYGVLPYNAPCKDCFELLQKRDESHRYFVKQGSHGKEFYAQSAYGDLSFKDAEGTFRTIDTRLKQGDVTGIYKSADQPFPVTINLPGNFTSVFNAGKELLVNRAVTIYIKHPDGSVTSLGQPSWSDYSAGDDGVMIHNFYPGIDLELRAGRGSMESFYHINKPLQLTDGWLVISDNMKLPDGFVFDYSNSEKSSDGFYNGALCINNPSGTRCFVVGSPVAYDINSEKDRQVGLVYGVSGKNNYDLYIPVSWMNDAGRAYPVIIDPLVTAVSTLPQVQITGSGYDPACFKNGCSYKLDVVVPPDCQLTDMTYSFNYIALGTCFLNQGAWDITYGKCRTPSALNTWHFCDISLPGLCILQNLSCFKDFQNCLPPPQCAGYTIPMILTFYRCVQPGPGCGSSCINADTPWDMTVTGRTVEVTTSDDTVCQGSSVNLTANASWGVPPYTYTWNPGNLNGQTVSVSPSVDTKYTVTVTTCGGADQAQAVANIKVRPNDNPGFIIKPNPACLNGPVTITGNGLAPDANFSWTLNGANTVNVKGKKSFIDSYANNGVYDITLHYNDGTCSFDSTLQISFLPPMTVVASGDVSICPGDSAQLSAVGQGGDGGPFTYTWSNGDKGNPITVTPDITTKYSVIASDDCGASQPSNDVTVTVFSAPPVNITANPPNPSEFSPIIQFYGTSDNAITWLWDFGDGSPTDATQNPTHRFPGAGIYIVKLTVTDSNGCTNTFIYPLDVHKEYLFYIPNAFTPNGDGLNDYFEPQGTEGILYDMTIYNKWGEEIFKVTNSDHPWEGQIAGSDKPAPEGVYVYRVKFNDAHYSAKEIVGSVLLVR